MRGYDSVQFPLGAALFARALRFLIPLHQDSRTDPKSIRGTTSEHAALEAQAEFYHHLPGGMARTTLGGVIELANQALGDLLGYSSEELVGMSFWDLTHPCDRAASQVFREKALNAKPEANPEAIEKRYVRKNGSVLYARVLTRLMYTEQGAPAYWLVQFSEIEDSWRQRRIDNAYRRVLELLTRGGNLEALLNAIIECTEQADPRLRAVVKLVDTYGMVFETVIAPSFGPGYLELFTGFRVRSQQTSCSTAVLEKRRVTVNDLLNHEDWHDLQDIVKASGAKACISEPILNGQGQVLGVFTLASDAPWTPTEIEESFCAGMARLVGLAVERYRTLDALHVSRARFRTMVEHAPEAVLVIDYHAGCFIEANERVRDVYKVSPSELLGSDPWRFAPPNQPNGQDSKEFLAQEIERARRGESPIFNYVARDGSGRDIDIEVRLTRLPTTSGALIRASVIDIAARLRAENELRASEAQLRTILESIDDVVIATDQAGYITHFNPVAERLTQIAPADAIGQQLDAVITLLDPETGERVESPLPGVLREEHTRNREGHLILVSKQDGDVFVSEHVAPIRGEHHQVQGMVLVLRDVSAWRLSQERSLQSRKLEAIGQLAGGVAHDFNNLLTGILGNAELLAEHGDTFVRTAAQTIALAARRSADVTRQLLRFSHKSSATRSAIDVHELIREALNLFRLGLEPNVEVRVELNAQKTHVLGEASQVQNALLNLCLNARDAIQTRGAKQGLIRIETSNPKGLSETVRIRISDNGCGIEPEIAGHIFEPFFTTKEIGTGTGLGLASTYGTVHSMNGSIQVEGNPGQGARFILDLPLSGSDGRLSGAPRPVQNAGSGRILVVDDEELVRHFIMRALKALGFEVVGAANGIDAEALFDEQDFDLVILDLVMPQRNGLDTYRALAAIRPDVRVVMASGYTRDHTAQDALSEGVIGFLNKPFQIAELADVVERALEANPSAGSL